MRKTLAQVLTAATLVGAAHGHENAHGQEKPVDVIWAPQPGPQQAAVECPVQDLFYGGQRGGGKTDFLLGDFAKHAGLYGEHAHGILFRRTMPELDEVVKRSRQIYRVLGWQYNEQKKTWTAPNGATLKFRYLDKDKDAGLYQGHQYTWMGFDEAGNWPKVEPIDELWACLRSAHGIPCVRRLTGNPGGVGHHWLKKRYIAPATPFTPHRWQPQPDTHPDLWIESVFIPAALEDNQILMQNDPGYEGRIAAATQGNEALWQAWRYGNWDVVAGAMFAEWSQQHHVLETFYPPSGWEVIGGMDGGVRHHSWLGIAVKGPEGDVVVTHEWYWKGKDFKTAGRDVAQAMRRIPRFDLPDEFDWGQLVIWADSSMFSDTGVGGLTQASEFQTGLLEGFGGTDAEPIPCPSVASAGPFKSKGSRHTGVSTVHKMLHYEVVNGEVPAHKRPLLRIHKRCSELIRTLPALPIDPDDIEDVDTEAEDHPFDGLKYMLMANTPAPERRQHETFNEDQHPGMDRGGKRRRPKKPLSSEEWQQKLGSYGFRTDISYGGPMEPAGDL